MKRFFTCCRNTALVGLLPLLLTDIAGPSYAQQAFSSPGAAATAFDDALVTDDPDALRSVLGPVTDAAARAMSRFDPGPGWEQVTP